MKINFLNYPTKKPHFLDALSEAFSDLAQKSPELQEEFLYNAESQRNLTKNGEILLNAINFFISSVNTLCNKTIEDSEEPALISIIQLITNFSPHLALITIRQFENARIEFDAYRMDMELTGGNGPANEETQRSFSKHKEVYEKLRSDVTVKMQFLEENRVSLITNY